MNGELNFWNRREGMENMKNTRKKSANILADWNF